jgi:ribosomal protein S18 acetylase RimI-like enzyme
MSQTISMRNARSQDMAVCAAMVNEWIDTTDWMPRMHSPEDVVKHYQSEVATKRQTIVAVDGARVRGFVTMTPDKFITALYVEQASRGRGIGGLLLEKAKRELSPEVSLYVFQDNVGAQKFYARHGFVEINRTSGDNDENLPDILMEWRDG